MANINHSSLVYRPLLGGISVLNPIVQRVGTLGFIATSNGQDRWMVSCYHVLGRINKSAFTDGEPIYQPVDDVENLVAQISLIRSNPILDCAAARIEPGIKTLGRVLELPKLSGTGEPVVGMRVIKSGCITGVTEGVVTQVAGDDVEIGIPANYPGSYELSREGDSGALWVSADDGRAVAMHKAGDAYGKPLSHAVRLPAVLTALQLDLVID